MDVRAILACLFVVSGFVVALPITAAGHLPKSQMCSSKMTAKAELACGQHAFYHGSGVVRSIRGLVLSRPLASQRRQQVMPTLMVTLDDHLWLAKAGKKWIAEARHRLSPPRPMIAHEALWNCIAYGARFGATYGTGEGGVGAYNPAGPYYNLLQMTWGWGSLDGNPNSYSPTEVYLAAEEGYRENGFSVTWLHGQWPQTSRRCDPFVEGAF